MHSEVLYDGVCNMCNKAVDVAIEKDPSGWKLSMDMNGMCSMKLPNRKKDTSRLQGQSKVGKSLLVHCGHRLGGTQYTRTHTHTHIGRRGMTPLLSSPLCLPLMFGIKVPARFAGRGLVGRGGTQDFGRRSKVFAISKIVGKREH
eukprot:2393867-Amphidinium_carterae.1